LKALPTFALLILLHFYLKRVFYKPLDRLLRQRWEATEGTRKRAEEGLAEAARKAGEYEEAIRTARDDIYREQEELRREWRRQQAAALEDARRRADGLIKEAKAGLAGEAETARRALEGDSEALAEQIANAVLERRPL